MKTLKLISMIAIVSMSIAACTNAPKSDEAKTTDEKNVSEKSGEAYKVDPSASEVTWIGTKVSGYHSGDVEIKSGELQVSDGNVVGGKFIMDMTTIVATGPKESNEEANGKLTGHLKSADFFDVEKHPEATFEITSVKPFSGTIKDEANQEEINKYKVTNPTHTVNGNLTIKGITKNIEAPASIIVNGNELDAVTKFNIDRKQWDLTYAGQPDDLIRDEIYFGIALKARK